MAGFSLSSSFDSIISLHVPHCQMILMISSSLSSTSCSMQSGLIAIKERTLVEFKDILSSDISTERSISCDFTEEKRATRVGYLMQSAMRSFSPPSLNICIGLSLYLDAINVEDEFNEVAFGPPAVGVGQSREQAQLRLFRAFKHLQE